ncbi:MAG: GDP-mannose 4,6-dehydratase, partial [Chitinispirillia bacterium]|nr:GDP-mannose 4,6-dehydratase [Chitinispirillia bacterium]
LDNLNEVKNAPRCSFVKGDICAPSAVKKLFDDNNFDAVVHFAAESHVDKSITGPALLGKR